jgi:hypothetical protein
MHYLRLITLGAVCVMIVAGCAKRPETASPDYANYLQAMDAVAQYESQVDRTIWTMETTEPVTLPAGLTMIVKSPPPPLPVPEMWRDHSYEAELAYYGQIWSVVGGVAIPTIGAAYQSYNNRKMIGDIMRHAGGAQFSADNDSEINFSGGWGDRSWGYQGGSSTESMDATDEAIVVTPHETSSGSNYFDVRP